MRAFSTEFTIKEKLLLLVLVLILVGLGYYWFVDQPVRDGIARAQAEEAAIQTEYTVVQAKIAELEKMKQELDSIEQLSTKTMMPSYNSSKIELELLNSVLVSAYDYSISFSNVTRNGDQIRRNFSLNFTTQNYDTMKLILTQLATNPNRCLIDNLTYSDAVRRVWENGEYVDYALMRVSCTATFYETMVGGVEDAGLPASK